VPAASRDAEQWLTLQRAVLGGADDLQRLARIPQQATIRNRLEASVRDEGVYEEKRDHCTLPARGARDLGGAGELVRAYDRLVDGIEKPRVAPHRPWQPEVTHASCHTRFDLLRRATLPR
jgi:hypothetical protein